MWKGFAIGKGKDCKIRSLAETVQGATDIEIVQDFTMNEKAGTIPSVAATQRRSSKSTIFTCGETGCCASFSTPQEAEAHMDTGKHVTQLEQETT